MNAVIQTNRYADGRLFLDVRGAYTEQPYLRRPRARPVFKLHAATTWPQLWAMVQRELKKAGYSMSSIRLYRQVLRQLRDSGLSTPARATRAYLKNYIHDVASDRPSWSWIATNISVLRTVFDKMAGYSATVGLATPKRPSRLPETLHQHQIMDILKAAQTIRDQLLLGLLYGCGLKVGELCSLRWRDVDLETERLRVEFARQTRTRHLDIPPALIPILRRGTEECSSDSFIFLGRKADTHLSTRAVEQVLKRACGRAQITLTTSCMVLRHSFAVHCLDMGMSIIEVRNALGHKSVETTIIYEACIPDRDENHPFTQMRRCYREYMKPTAIPQASSIAGLQLPFRDERQSAIERANEFYRALKARVVGQFLTLIARSP